MPFTVIVKYVIKRSKSVVCYKNVQFNFMYIPETL